MLMAFFFFYCLEILLYVFYFVQYITQSFFKQIELIQ
jgi:hypothetical protein